MKGDIHQEGHLNECSYVKILTMRNSTFNVDYIYDKFVYVFALKAVVM